MKRCDKKIPNNKSLAESLIFLFKFYLWPTSKMNDLCDSVLRFYNFPTSLVGVLDITL